MFSVGKKYAMMMKVYITTSSVYYSHEGKQYRYTLGGYWIHILQSKYVRGDGDITTAISTNIFAAGHT